MICANPTSVASQRAASRTKETLPIDRLLRLRWTRVVRLCSPAVDPTNNLSGVCCVERPTRAGLDHLTAAGALRRSIIVSVLESRRQRRRSTWRRCREVGRWLQEQPVCPAMAGTSADPLPTQAKYKPQTLPFQRPSTWPTPALPLAPTPKPATMDGYV